MSGCTWKTLLTMGAHVKANCDNYKEPQSLRDKKKISKPITNIMLLFIYVVISDLMCRIAFNETYKSGFIAAKSITNSQLCGR